MFGGNACPAGRVTDEFERAWNFEIDPGGRDNPWARDMDRIFTNLHVVVNNGLDRVGGGGRPRAPRAEPLSELKGRMKKAGDKG